MFDYQTVEQRAERILELERWELGLEEPLNWPDRVARVSTKQVRSAAKTHIHPEAISRVVVKRGGAKPKVNAFPWWLMALIAPLVPTVREMREMRYLWNVPLDMPNDKLIAVLGHEPHTPMDAAVEATLVGMGCLAAAPSPAAVSLIPAQ